MRFLIVTMQYPTTPGQSYLTTELADALVAAGHAVEVLHLDWHAAANSATEEFTTTTGIRVVRCAAKSISHFGKLVRNASKFVLSGLHAAQVARSHFDLTSFDAAIAWMPATAIAPLVRMIERARIPNRLLFIWDFFPEHHHEIGRISGGLPLWVARAWEQALLKRFTAILCTLQGNADYLRRHFRVQPSQRVLVTPIWGDTSPVARVDRAAVRRRHSLPSTVPIAVFGGQLVEGRGFEQMFDAADSAMNAGSKMVFLFVGDGRLAAAIRKHAETRTNVFYRPSLSRSQYLELLGACDVGMVATVPGVSSYSIPSKTIDYLRAALPIIAAVEHGNDYARILEHYDVGVAVPFGEPALFYAEAERLAYGGRITEAAARCLEEIFDVRHAVTTVLDAVDPGAQARPRPTSRQPNRKPPHKRSAVPSPHPS
jgi:glycosyltransferase involved in cell wall biosynthesis